jgi:hypothetical protein
MIRYFYAWTPLVFVTTLVVLAIPWLGLIALAVFSLVALGALALGAVVAPFMLIQAINHRWHRHSDSSAQPALAPSRAAGVRVADNPVEVAS